MAQARTTTSLACEYARSFDPTPEAAQRIDLVRKVWDVAGVTFRAKPDPTQEPHSPE
jgi:hypothetical protein